MYRKPDGQMTIEDFILPFEGKLKADNRWVKMAEIIPWDEIEQEYAKSGTSLKQRLFNRFTAKIESNFAFS